MSVGAGFARDDVFRPKRWLPKPETSYHLNAQLGVRKRFVSFYSAGFAAIDPGVLLARRTRPAFRKRLARARRRPLSCRPARLQWCLILDICAADGLNFPAIIRRGPVRLVDLIPDAEVLCALEPDELGLRMLPVLAEWERVHRETVPLSLENFVSAVSGHRPNYDGEYGRQHSASIEQADREAWAWLE